MPTPRALTLALAAGAPLAALAPPALAQTRFLFLDRTTSNNRLWMIDDLDAGGSIQEPAELGVFWSSANAAATPAMQTPQGIAFHAPTGRIAAGDNSAAVRGVYLFQDHNRSGDAQAPAESVLAASSPNPSGFVLNILGIAFDGPGDVYVSTAFNSGAGSSAAVYRLHDGDGDGKFMTGGEITEYVFMAASSSYVPGDLVIDASVTPFVGYVKSSAGNIGVYRFSDTGGNGRADDPGEFTPFITTGNAAGVTIAAGALTLALDPVRPQAVYFTQISSSQRQLIRARDLSAPANGNAMDAGEAAVVWSTAEAITIIGLAALPDGRVMITDANRRLLVLTPTGETFNNYSGTPFPAGTGYSVFYTASNLPGGSPPTPGSVRQIVPIPRPCAPNCDDSATPPILNVADFTCFLQKFAAGDPYANCDSSSTPPTLNVADFTCFLQSFAAGCP